MHVPKRYTVPKIKSFAGRYTNPTSNQVNSDLVWISLKMYIIWTSLEKIQQFLYELRRELSQTFSGGFSEGMRWFQKESLGEFQFEIIKKN